ncbi:MAG: LemA family protein, partial [Actinobacteria bacterium]|nr:LemA family protein [Actinomycetota bacterium]
MDASLLIIIAVGLFVVFAIIQYNRLVRLNVQVDEAFAQIEVQLKRRADLIPNLVETVKGYASHEREALEKVVQARAASTTASTLPAVAAADGMLTNAL